MNTNHARTILHIDLDCFYCQVEQKRLGLPRNVPAAVQQWEGLIAINYAARAAGITRHMRVHEARALCPELKLMHVETIGGDQVDTKDRTKQKACLERYRRACYQILAVLHKAAPQAIIEKASIDEVYMDVTSMVEKELRERAQADSCAEPEHEEEGANDWECGGLPVDAFSWGSIVLGGGPLAVGSEFERRLSIGANIACRLRKCIRDQLGFTCSAGIAANKLLAKVASAMNKPNQQTIVPPRAVDSMMADLPLKKLRNFGGKLGAELAAMGCTTAGQVAKLPHGQLTHRFGPERAAAIARAVRGYSDEPVQVKELAKSMLAAKSFNQTSKPAELDRWLGILAEELATRLSEDCAAHSRAPRGLSLSYRGSNGDRSKAGPAPRPTKEGYSTDALQEAGSLLLRKCHDIYPCSRLALQANDFYELPLSDDQGAISRYLTVAAPGDGCTAAGPAAAAVKPKRSGPQQPSITQMFKRAAAAAAAAQPPAQEPLPRQEGCAAASSDQPPRQRDMHQAQDATAPIPFSDDEVLCTSAVGAAVDRPSNPAVAGEPSEQASKSAVQQNGGEHCCREDGLQDPGNPKGKDDTAEQQPTIARGLEGESQQQVQEAGIAAWQGQMHQCAAAEEQPSAVQARRGGGTGEQGQNREEQDQASTMRNSVEKGSSEHVQPEPSQHADGNESSTPSLPADVASAGQPECDLAAVNVEEQKRILRDIWMRGQGTAAAKTNAGVDDSKAAVHGTPGLAKTAVKRSSTNAGPSAKEGAGKQMRISAMFKAPRRQ